MTLSDFDLDELSPKTLWNSLDSESRVAAARAFYLQSKDEPSIAAEADGTLARALRFRVSRIRTMPIDKKASYLVRLVRPDEAFASSLLLALHLGERKDMLGRYLDELGIANEDGVISGDDDEEFKPPEDDAIKKAVAAIDADFPKEHVDVYLASLYAMDRDSWSGLRAVLEERIGPSPTD